MLPFENIIADYVKETENHVLYRVTPVFEDDKLLASGVLMGGWSVEYAGECISFCVFAYNAQPGVDINYANGESKAGEMITPKPATPLSTQASPSPSPSAAPTDEAQEEQNYILNTNWKKFHLPGCNSVANMSESNKAEYTGS